MTEAGLLAGDRAAPIGGHTPRSLAAAVGVEARSLADVFADGPGVGVDERLVVDDDHAGMLLDALVLGAEALRAFAPGAVPVLWPEHFDVTSTTGEVNYGIPPGDDPLPVAYAYVGPWTPPAPDVFWTEPFGVARPMSSFADAEAVRMFFVEGRDRLPG